MHSGTNLVLIGLAVMANALPNPAVCYHGTSTTNTKLVGDGDPHQRFIFKQVTGGTECDDNPNGWASYSSSETVSWSASIGFTGEFIDAGFTVSKSVTTGSGNGFGCMGDKGHRNGTLCVFERIQMTAFTAHTQICQSDCMGERCGAFGDPATIFAPNTAQGSCFYDNFQLGLTCGSIGTEHLVQKDLPGGPQFVGCDPYMDDQQH